MASDVCQVPPKPLLPANCQTKYILDKKSIEAGPRVDYDEIVYTSLIQTYLGLLCYDNAIFLAERLAAHCPQSENAIYLLSYCHYRSGSPKQARSVLLTRWLGRTAPASCSRWSFSPSVYGGSEANLERTRSAARYLLAKCCFDLGLYDEAEEALLRHCREVFFKAVSDGKGNICGAKVRGNVNDAMDKWILQTTPCPVPNGPAGLQLLGNICRKSNRRQRAMDYFRLSLKLDPLMWTSYEAICELGGPTESRDEADDPNEIFGVPAPTLSPRNDGADIGTQHVITFARGDSSSHSIDKTESAGGNATFEDPSHSFKINRYGTPSTPYSGFDRLKIGGKHANNHSQLSAIGPTRDASDTRQYFHRPATASTIASRTRELGGNLPQTNLFNATPSLNPQKSLFQSPIVETQGSTNSTPKSVRPSSAVGYANQVIDRARRVVAGLYYEPSPETPSRNIIRVHSPEAVGGHDFNTDVGMELSFSSNPLATPVDAPLPFHANISSVKGNKRPMSATTKQDGEGTNKPNSQKTTESARGSNVELLNQSIDATIVNRHVGKILELMCSLGAAYKSLCQYRSRDALELFRQLPPSHISTGWVQHQIGKAYFEMSDYQNAQRALECMQKIEPHRMKGLDILSTTLWQMKKEVELSDLAQRAVDFDRKSPEAWFVVGNCFSFQKEHETAITFFRRSIQLDPSYTYAHTLCGHEYMSNEDFEKAISCYRDAIRVDSRHYNAWYGLGAIYFRQEKFDLSEYHFQRALEINPQSSVLHCHLGMAQHSNGKTSGALDTLAGAFRLDPRNPQAHYQRATIFMSLDRPQEALAELEQVRSAAPRESSVHFNMGKVLKRLGQPEKAMRCFLTALDLDPKDNNLIKAAMDRLDEPDVDEEVSVF